MEVIFCYVIAAEAGMAFTADDEKEKVYVKATIQVQEPLTAEENTHMHEVLMIYSISEQTGIDRKFFTPITYEEYVRDADEDL